MTWFQSKQDEKLKQLLKISGSDFQFDATPTKYRLITSVNETSQASRAHFRIGRVAKYSVGFAGTVIFLSVTVSFASSSKPGDKLFALNKFGEQVVLHLPLSVEQKAKVETYIVTNRVQALDQVQTKQSSANSQLQAKQLDAVQETDETFTSAVDEISQNKQALEAKGDTQAATDLENVLDQLQTMAGNQEATIEALEAQTNNATVKVQIQNHLSALRNSRLKARSEIKRYKNTQNQNSDNSNNLPDNTTN